MLANALSRDIPSVWAGYHGPEKAAKPQLLCITQSWPATADYRHSQAAFQRFMHASPIQAKAANTLSVPFSTAYLLPVTLRHALQLSRAS